MKFEREVQFTSEVLAMQFAWIQLKKGSIVKITETTRTIEDPNGCWYVHIYASTEGKYGN